jgi:ribosomal protein L37AE/L43A
MSSQESKVAETLAYRLKRNMKTGQATARVFYECPACGKIHRSREIYGSIPANFSVVGREATCGAYVQVRMPWAGENKNGR